LSFRHPGPSAFRHGARASRHLIVRDVAGLIVGVLLLLSGILMATILFPDIDVVAVTGYLALAMSPSRTTLPQRPIDRRRA
jgi:hypothetical protein